MGSALGTPDPQTLRSSANDVYQSGPSDSDQWLRRWNLTLMGPQGNIILTQEMANPDQPPAPADNLRMTFRTTQNRVSTPGVGVITVFNLNLAALLGSTPFASFSSQYNRVVLSCGFRKGYYGIIFDGVITYVVRGRDDDLVDTFLEIHAQNGDWALNGTVLNHTLAAGRTGLDAAKVAAGEMEKNGVSTAELKGPQYLMQKLPRGQVLYGRATDALSNIGANHYVEGTELHIFNTAELIDKTFVVNSRSGMVGMPRPTPEGMEVTTLINAAFRLRQQVQIDQASVNQLAAGVAVGGNPPGGIATLQGYSVGFFADTTADGLYSILSIEFEGDTRGTPWYAHLICLSSSATGPGRDQALLGSGLRSNPPLDQGLGPTSQQLATMNKPPQATSGAAAQPRDIPRIENPEPAQNPGTQPLNPPT